MDKELIIRSFAKAIKTYNANADIQAYAAGKIVELLKSCGYPEDTLGESMLEVGCGTGNFGRLFLQEFTPKEMIFNDICPEMEEAVSNLSVRSKFVCCDAEQMDFSAESFGLLASCSVIQWMERPFDFLRKAVEWLLPGGYIALSTFGPRNCEEVRKVAAAGLDYPKLEEYVEVLEEKCELLHSSQEIVTKDFPDAVSVLRHLKATGVNGITRDGRHWTKGMMDEFERNYPRMSAAGNAVLLTYHPLYIVARKR